ncbi:UDP-glycosyltransferase UGT5-like [Schistocerca serialis cubense]|uniref:UDP-glycosyltransferase UGT5-like n=1 Tax=Schistocerca serialis cubense TaxID=2023355 RepID=UPI00214E14F0|nr:UDP-glycosyltransferase UGT5-like [Schistocerca serialis cubense]
MKAGGPLWAALLLLLPLLLLQNAPVAGAANILAPVWFVSPSHFVMLGRLFSELAARGHNVTVLSHFPRQAPQPNYTDISIAGSLPSYADKITMDLVEMVSSPFGLLYNWHFCMDACRTVYEHPEVEKLVHSQDHYDLVIAEIFYVDCMAVFAHKFRAPLVGIVTSMAFPTAYDRMGNPDHPAYMDSYFSPHSAPFTFWQRVKNSFLHVAARFCDWWFAERGMDQLLAEVFGDAVPPIREIVRNTSLLLVNSHWSAGHPVPTVPGLVEVGGLHVKEPKPLPQELQQFLDGSPQGVVYFSLGTMVRPDTFAPEKLQALLDVFSELPQRVLWKVDPTKVPRLPPNVMARKWMPQNDVLNHPNVLVFITHSGLMGTQEAVAAGVPMLAMPMFGDQFLNADRVVAGGSGLKLLYRDLSRGTLAAALNQLLNDPRYRERAKQLSRLFRDRPRPPLEEAVYWVEYVIRHRGAPHLRSAALDLAWYQYLLLDVAAFVVATMAAALLVLYLVVRKILSCLVGASRPVPKGKKRN